MKTYFVALNSLSALTHHEVLQINVKHYKAASMAQLEEYYTYPTYFSD